MQPVYDPFHQVHRLAPSLPTSYPVEQLVADVLVGNVFLVEDDGLIAAIQFTGQDTLQLLAIAGRGCTTAKLYALSALTERSEIACCPMTPAHVRLYKRLGFKESGEELVWRS